MKISLNWLNRHVDLGGLEPDRIALDLTLSTAETEGVERFGAVLDELVVGEVVECAPHPDADKLSITRVADGSGETLPVICGAPNVAQGQKIALARIGTVLPGEMKIEKAKIRGVQSCGMICSERELELSDEHTGIMVLDPAATVGARVSEALPAATDWVIEVDNKSITHRPDLWGHFGFARELAAIYDRELAPYPAPEPLFGDAAAVPVEILDEVACPRYVAYLIEGVSIGPSPSWMRYLLQAVGQRPISNIVDLSNFVMFDLGQPNHTFDADRLRGGRITVRRARAGEVLTTLDEIERKLCPDDLLICDGDEAVAVAGVMGGATSEVGEPTTRLVLESANFEPTGVRRTAQRLGLRTEASARFEKSLDPCWALHAADRFAALIQEICPGARVAAPASDAGSWKRPGSTIRLRHEMLERRLGTAVERDRVQTILHGLGFATRAQGAELDVDVPTWRATKDVTLEADLVEEIGRMIRYDNIPEQAPSMPVLPPHRDEARELKRVLGDAMAGPLGFFEALNYSFLADEMIGVLGEDPGSYLEVLNPIAAGLVRMRREAIPSLLGSLVDNLRREERVALFEFAKGYLPEHLDERAQPTERHWLGAVLAHRPGSAPPAAPWADGAYRRITGVLEELLLRAGVEEFTLEASAPSDAPAWAHPGCCARILSAGTELGRVAEIHPRVLQALEIEAEVGGFQVDLAEILAVRTRLRQFRALPRFPGRHLDVSIAVAPEVLAADLAGAIRAVDPERVARVELFDVYSGESLGGGRKSMAFKLVLQSDQRTLSDKDLARFLDKLDRTLQRAGHELRRE